MRRLVVVVVAMMIAQTAHGERRPLVADFACRHCEQHEHGPARRTLAVGAAIVPGILARGAGTYVLGHEDAARPMFKLGLLTLAATVGAGVAIGFSGGSPYTVPAIPIVVGGAGLTLSTWLTDIYTAAGGDRVSTTPTATSPWSVDVGTTWQHDAYRERALLRAGGRYVLDRANLGAAVIVDAQGDAQLGEADVRVRILGPAASGERIERGDYLHARGAVRYHRDDPDDVTQLVGEVEVIGRVDLWHIHPVFGSNFFELSTGVGAVRASYARDTSDIDSLLLGRFAWGTYLPRRGEVTLFYDHRRDGLAGGLPAGRAAGFLGSFGSTLEMRVTGPWAARAELQVGNAWLTTLGVGYRGGS